MGFPMIVVYGLHPDTGVKPTIILYTYYLITSIAIIFGDTKTGVIRVYRLY